MFQQCMLWVGGRSGSNAGAEIISWGGGGRQRQHCRGKMSGSGGGVGRHEQCRSTPGLYKMGGGSGREMACISLEAGMAS